MKRGLKIKLTGLIFLVFISNLIFAFELEEIEPSSNFEESFNPEVKVSGHIIAGVMISGAYKGLTKETLVLSPVRTEKTQEICLKVSSRDGVYQSSGSYTINFGSKKYKQLPYKTKFKELENFKEDEIAIIAYSGACIKNSNRYHLPFAIQPENAGQTSLKNHSLEIFINGFDATTVEYEIKVDGKIKNEDCSHITEGRHTAYNYSCRIEKIAGMEKPMSITIYRERYGRELPSVSFDIVGLLPK